MNGEEMTYLTRERVSSSFSLKDVQRAIDSVEVQPWRQVFGNIRYREAIKAAWPSDGGFLWRVLEEDDDHAHFLGPRIEIWLSRYFEVEGCDFLVTEKTDLLSEIGPSGMLGTGRPEWLQR